MLEIKSFFATTGKAIVLILLLPVLIILVVVAVVAVCLAYLFSDEILWE